MRLHEPESLARHQEVAGCQHVPVLVPFHQARLGNRRARRQSSIVDDYIDTTESQRGLLKGLAYAVLVGDVHLDGDRSSGTEVLVEICSQLLRTGEIDVGSDNVRAILRHAPADGRTDASRRSGHQRHVPRELALRRCLLELVLL